MSRIDGQTREQIAKAYVQMALDTNYRPYAPGDGLGNITAPLSELDLTQEALDYVDGWWDEENDATFTLGTCNYPTRPSTVYAVEACRLMAAGDTGDGPARKLLQMALEALPE